MANNTWKNYTQKNTALSDNDEVMLLDSTDEKNKRGLMSKFWDYVVDKMSTAVISNLQTSNKSVIGALNELNSKPLFSNIGNITIEISNTQNDPVELAFPIGTEFLYVSYGMKNITQSYGGATLIIDVNEVKPCFVQIYTDTNLRGYLYLYANPEMHKLKIYGINLQDVALVKVKGR